MEPSIVCPNCQTEIKLTETLAAPLIEAAKRDSEAKLKQREAEIAKEEAKKAQAAVALDLNQKAQQLEELKKAYDEHEAKLKEAQKAQAEAVRKERELADAKRELDLTIEKRVAESQAEIQMRAKAEAEQALLLKVQEKEQAILGMQKQIEDLKRKSEQGSQQLQGEVQELQLESLLRASFPHDAIVPVPKGETGGDTIQEVITPFGQPCGKILWESKRTRNWNDGWLQKLRDDQRAAKADAAIIVSQALPKNIDVFGQIDGIWITAPKCAVAVALAVRHALIEVTLARKSSEGQQSKMEIMYRYLTGPRFRHRVQAIVEKFQDMQGDLEKERRAMQRAWAKREQQIQGIIEATSGMWGDMQGIAGQSLKEIEGLEFDGVDASEDITVKGLRAKTEVWAHSCWGNPSQQRMFAKVQSYKASLETYNKIDADVITFESASSGGMDLEAIGKTITGKKIAIGVIDHHTLQVETPDEVAAQIRAALKYIPPERLVISSDCGMGREGMSRRHAFYKMVSLVLGTNMVRKELGFPEAPCLAADERYSLVVPAK